VRSSHVAFAALLLLGSAGAAKAATVTENLVGKISGPNTVDTIGLFGPAGADLTGQPISIYFKYTTEALIGFRGGEEFIMQPGRQRAH